MVIKDSDQMAEEVTERAEAARQVVRRVVVAELSVYNQRISELERRLEKQQLEIEKLKEQQEGSPKWKNGILK